MNSSPLLVGFKKKDKRTHDRCARVKKCLKSDKFEGLGIVLANVVI